MAYSINNHSLLVGEYGQGELQAQQRVAEMLLGLSDVAEFTTNPKKQQAEDAIALQVSYQKEMGIDAFAYYERVRGQRRDRYRGTRRAPPIHPSARKIASKLINSTVTEAAR